MYSSVVSRALLLSASLSLFAVGARADCYWSDGTENDSHQPCYASRGGAAGLCCASGDICMTSGICMASSQSSGQGLSGGHASAYYRGSCMYKDWSQGKNCPSVCLKGPGTKPDEVVSMMPCPASDTDWYCGDGNMKKANCTSGEYIVSLAKASTFATIGVSPSMSATPQSMSPPTALGGGDHSATVTSPAASPSATATSNSTAPVLSGDAGSSASAAPAASTTTDFAPSGSGSGSASAAPSPPSPEQSGVPEKSSAVPLAVGISVGGAALIGAGVLGFFLWRRRRDASSLARAETPPPRDTPDIDFTDPMTTGQLFRPASLTRRPSNDYLNTIGRTGPTSPEALTTERAHSMRTNSMRSHHSTAQHTRSVSQDRFGPDVVAMHDMRRTPPASWGYPRTETIPEIPFDGRRLPPYHGMPVLENNGFYSELPG